MSWLSYSDNEIVAVFLPYFFQIIHQCMQYKLSLYLINKTGLLRAARPHNTSIWDEFIRSSCWTVPSGMVVGWWVWLLSAVVNVLSVCNTMRHFTTPSRFKNPVFTVIKAQTNLIWWKNLLLNGIIHPEMKVLSSFTHFHVFLNLYDFLSSVEYI